MASASTSAAATKSILNPVMTLKGHREYIRSISYFPDGQQMISGSLDKTTRQWDLKTGEEIEEVRGVCEKDVAVVAVSRDGRWAVNGGGDYETGELKVCEVETGIMKILKGCSGRVTCIDISADSTLLASSCSFASDCSMRIWNLETGKLVGGPFESVKWACAVRFSTDSKKVAIKSNVGKCLEVWDVQNQKLDVSIGKSRDFDQGWVTHAPIFWTNKNKTILASFSFEDDRTKTVKTIYEFDASTLEIVGAPFKGHTDFVTGLTLSSDCTLLASAAYDHTIKLWAFESRQLLASFDVQNPNTSLILSPDSRQLAYTTDSDNDYKIYICNTPPDVLAQTCALKKSPLSDLLNSDATSRPHPGRRRPPRSAIPIVQRSPHTIDPQQPISHRLRKLLRCYPHTNVARPVPPRNPLDVPATLPLPSSLLGQAATRFDHFEISPPRHPLNGPVTQFLRQHLSFLVPSHSHIPPVVEIVPGRKFTRLAAVNLPEYKKVNDTRHPPQAGVPEDIDSSDVDSLPDVHWCKALLCYYSCWSHGRLRMPPRWRLERVNVPRQGGTTNTSGSGSGAL